LIIECTLQGKLVQSAMQTSSIFNFFMFVLSTFQKGSLTPKRKSSKFLVKFLLNKLASFIKKLARIVKKLKGFIKKLARIVKIF
jgi:hypothetical protein